MSTTTTPAADVAEQPAATPTGVTPAAKPLSADEAREILRAGSKPQFVDKDPLSESPEGEDPLLTHEQDKESDPLGSDEPAEEPEKETAETEVETPVETPDAVAEEVEATAADPVKAAEEEPESPKGRKRVNIFRKNDKGEFVHDAKERAAMQFADEEGIGFMQAWTRLFGDTPKAEAKPADDTPAPKADPTPLEITEQIKALRVARKTASESLDQSKANEITEQIEDLIDAKNLAMQREADRGRVKQTEAQRSAEAQQASMTAAAKLFPDAIRDGSELNTAMTVEIARLEKSNPSFFQDPEWPESLTAKLATRMGIAPATSKPPEKPAAKPAAEVPVKPAAKVAPKQAARPAPSPGGIPAPATKANAQDFRVRLEDARTRNDLPAIKALMREARTLTA